MIGRILKVNANLLKGKFFKMPLLTRLSHSLPDKSSLFKKKNYSNDQIHDLKIESIVSE